MRAATIPTPTTRIEIVNEVSGNVRTVDVPLAEREVLDRLALAMPVPEFDTVEEGIALYAVSHDGVVSLVVFGYGHEEAHAELNRIIGELRKGGAQ